MGTNGQPNTRLGVSLLSMFEHIYVINLPSRTDRKKEIGRQLARIGLSFDHPSVSLFPASRPEDRGEFPTIGTRGCYESHMAVIKSAIAQGWKTYLVLEDDADFSSDFEHRIEALVASARKIEWDIFYGWMPEGDGEAGPAGPDTLAEIPAGQGVLQTHFMGFKSAVLDELISYIEAIYHRPEGDPRGGAMHVDGAISWFRAAHPHYRTFAPTAPVAIQRPSRSDIHSLRWFDRIDVLSPMLVSLRRLKVRLRPSR